MMLKRELPESAQRARGFVLPKGTGVIVGALFLSGLMFWAMKSQFLHGNVWHEDRIMEADAVERKVDFLGLRVADFVEQSISAVTTCLFIIIVYLCVRMGRIDRRLAELEGRAGDRQIDPGSGG